MMLLIGIWMSFTKKPMNPMIANPIAVAMAIFWNSKTYTYTFKYQIEKINIYIFLYI